MNWFVVLWTYLGGGSLEWHVWITIPQFGRKNHPPINKLTQLFFQMGRLGVPKHQLESRMKLGEVENYHGEPLENPHLNLNRIYIYISTQIVGTFHGHWHLFFFWGVLCWGVGPYWVNTSGMKHRKSLCFHRDFFWRLGLDPMTNVLSCRACHSFSGMRLAPFNALTVVIGLGMISKLHVIMHCLYPCMSVEIPSSRLI